MRAVSALAGAARASLALLAISGGACAPGAFDELHEQEHRDPSVACEEAWDELCASESTADASELELDAEPEPDAASELEPELDAETEAETEPEPVADACTSCTDDDAAPLEIDAEVCSSCVQPPGAAQCSDEAGAMCRPDAGADACGGAAPVCSAGQRQNEQRACGACNTGKQTRTRSCAADGCSWSAWSAWTDCGGVTAACTPNQTTGCTNGDTCGHRVCSSSCTWGACVPKVANGCLRIREGHTDQGSNYRCCGVGRWQFCMPDCHWSTDCVACSQGAPSYCTECY